MDKTYTVIFASHDIFLLDDDLSAVLSGSLRFKNNLFPVTGDRVIAEEEGGTAVIKEILPRKTELRRMSDGNKGGQLLAANADSLLIVMALDSNFSIKRLERFLVLAASAKMRAVTALTKADVCPPADAAVMEAEAGDVCEDVFVVSAVTGEGMDALMGCFLPDDTVCMAGLSGAGKSTLLNAMTGSQTAETGEVRIYDSKGRHTTTARQMYHLKSGLRIIDSPGVREVGVTEDTEAVSEVFDDITEISRLCRYKNCLHTGEPGCAVAKAVEDGRLRPERLASYRRLITEAENADEQVRRHKKKMISRVLKNYKKIMK